MQLYGMASVSHPTFKTGLGMTYVVMKFHVLLLKK